MNTIKTSNKMLPFTEHVLFDITDAYLFNIKNHKIFYNIYKAKKRTEVDTNPTKHKGQLIKQLEQIKIIPAQCLTIN